LRKWIIILDTWAMWIIERGVGIFLFSYDRVELLRLDLLS